MASCQEKVNLKLFAIIIYRDNCLDIFDLCVLGIPISLTYIFAARLCIKGIRHVSELKNTV
jgi:hypothetical protein